MEVRAFVVPTHSAKSAEWIEHPADAVKAFGTDWTGGAPYTVLIGTNGEVLYKTQGQMNVLDVRRAILKSLPDDYYKGQHVYWNSTF